MLIAICKECGARMETMAGLKVLCANCNMYCDVVIDDPARVLMPTRLTAEDGHKFLLNGEYKIQTYYPNEGYCGCGECFECTMENGMKEEIDMEVPVPWTMIKDIYQRVVEFEKSKKNK